ncbi:MAG: hypothetical protein M1813_006756 [Trichoglossum hirsutum]|nr:MAG: hypothetical protein M1813_006756 [Trichoglossum hirsutum]
MRALLPASAAPFKPRSPPKVVFKSTGRPPWLVKRLQSVHILYRQFRSEHEVLKNLSNTLSSPQAIWVLCSLMFPKAPKSQLLKDSNPLVEAISNYQLIHIQSYIISVDLVQTNTAAFKLTSESVTELEEYYKNVYLIDIAAACNDWSEEKSRKHQDEFSKSVNGFAYQTKAWTLLDMERDGSGELSHGRSDEVKTAIMRLFPPLLPSTRITRKHPLPTSSHHQVVSGALRSMTPNIPQLPSSNTTNWCDSNLRPYQNQCWKNAPGAAQ